VLKIERTVGGVS